MPIIVWLSKLLRIPLTLNGTKAVVYVLPLRVSVIVPKACRL